MNRYQLEVRGKWCGTNPAECYFSRWTPMNDCHMCQPSLGCVHTKIKRTGLIFPANFNENRRQRTVRTTKSNDFQITDDRSWDCGRCACVLNFGDIHKELICNEHINGSLCGPRYLNGTTHFNTAQLLLPDVRKYLTGNSGIAIGKSNSSYSVNLWIGSVGSFFNQKNSVYLHSYHTYQNH